MSTKLKDRVEKVHKLANRDNAHLVSNYNKVLAMSILFQMLKHSLHY